MRIARLARIHLTLAGDQAITVPPLQEFRVGDVSVQPLKLDADGRFAELVVAVIAPLRERLNVRPDGKPVISHALVRACEEGVVQLASAMGVAELAPVQITSVQPHVALLPDDGDEQRELDELSLDYVTPGHAELFLRPSSVPAELLLQLRDRGSAVGDLGDALTARTDTMRLFACWRLFENAFRRPIRHLAKPLHEFLHPAMGYTETEVRRWAGVRNELIHADRDPRPAPDGQRLRRLVQRSTQAACDVIANKSHWRSDDAGREERWFPAHYTTRPTGGQIVTHSPTLDVTPWIFDRFGVFLIDLAGIERLPDGWWPDLDRLRAHQAANPPPTPGEREIHVRMKASRGDEGYIITPDISYTPRRTPGS
jgi:hypothetical protein